MSPYEHHPYEASFILTNGQNRERSFDSFNTKIIALLPFWKYLTRYKQVCMNIMHDLQAENLHTNRTL